ncbi:hypothetical protein C2E21_8371 [Chlorella sorokiniana]|uniref:Uncharacterized protein n=1 Tax=Chlorella sorokiniana TaxID=3076 RepID=A0A2P6TEV4_CHLSO|nr:hypothetical protein C2E21_8371 [Chlorella sorokiniana]|eukprot:PRW32493.1 hypothetical protein C2E21_8371 [Chlorella sorokiniana]
MAALAPVQSLLHLDNALVAIPEDAACCSTSQPAAPARWVDHERLLAAGEARVRPLRKCASVPTLHSMQEACGESEGMEVYVILRPFKEFGGGLFRRLPKRVKNGVRDCGLCHYLAVFKQKDGSLVQFDFGPRGGDIHVARGPFAFLSKSADGKMQRLVPGEVRERRLMRLPDAHMYVGRTPLSLEDIRAWNALQEQGSMHYELHRNDCRHYINCLVKYTTGREQAASACLAAQWQRARQLGTYGLATSVVRLTQFFTDLANWGKVQLIGNVSMYGMMALSGQKVLARLPALLPGAKAKLQPVVSKALAGGVKRALTGPVRTAIARKPVVVGTAAMATLAASSSQAPMIKETVSVGARVARAAQATIAAASTAVTRASAATVRTTSQAAVAVGSITRGAVALAAGRPMPLALEWGRAASPPRASLGMRAADRSQRLALAITSAARR